MLTFQQEKLLKFIIDYQKQNNVTPSFDEMKDGLDLKSKSGIHRIVSALEERGYIKKLNNRARAIEIIKNVNLIESIVGNQGGRKLLKCEKVPRKNARRSIVTCGSINKGEKFTMKNLIMKRPGTGISPLSLNKILGKKSKKFLKDDHILRTTDIEG